jgi:hypothetical protein
MRTVPTSLDGMCFDVFPDLHAGTTAIQDWHLHIHKDQFDRIFRYVLLDKQVNTLLTIMGFQYVFVS